MQTYLNIAQIVMSIILICFVMLQSRGGGLTGASQDQTTVFRTRRGFEKTLFQMTLVLGALFVVVSILNVVLVSRL